MSWLLSMVWLWGIPSILQRFGNRKEFLRDERDLYVLKNASLIAHASSWIYLFAACLVAGWRAGAQGVVSVKVIAMILVGGIVVFQIALSTSCCVQEKSLNIHG